MKVSFQREIPPASSGSQGADSPEGPGGALPMPTLPVNGRQSLRRLSRVVQGALLGGLLLAGLSLNGRLEAAERRSHRLADELEDAGPVQQRAALLNFTPRNLDAEKVAAFSRNLRETFLLEGRCPMLDEREMYSILDGQDGTTQLRQARVLLSDGKKLFRAGQFDAAMARLNEARSLHRSLYSELSRADEMADVLFFQGMAQLRLQKPEAAQMSFVQMFLLDPTFDVERVPERTPVDNEVLEGARRLERAAPLRGISSSFAHDIARRLDVSHLLVGVVDGRSAEEGGGASVKIVVQGTEKNQVVTTLVFELESLDDGVPPVGAAVYRRILAVTSRYLPSR